MTALQLEVFPDERVAPDGEPDRNLNKARLVLWLVTGEDKIDALRRLRAGDRSIPAGRVEAANALVVADTAAAGD